MYLKMLVEIPDAKGKIVLQKKGKTTYVYYETDRTYDPEVQYTTVKRVTIGKLSKDDDKKMQPNENFLRYFPDAELPEEDERAERSSCMRIGTYVVVSQMLREMKIREMLEYYMNPKDAGLLLDLAQYSIVEENNAAQHYPDYAYSHPLFTDGMKIYSDSKISDFLKNLTEEQSAGFLNEWNSDRNYREKIYISYDSTNKNCQAGDIEMAEFGNAKDDPNLPIFNYAVAYDTYNREPLFYEKYPGSINDVSQLQYAIDKAKSYGYKKIGFILDRGYFSKGNIEYMDSCGYSFVMMVKGMASFVHPLIDEISGSFEHQRKNYIGEYDVYGITVKRRLYETDDRLRYFHFYYNSTRASSEEKEINQDLESMKNILTSKMNKEEEFGPMYEKYFRLHYKGQVFTGYEEKVHVAEEEIKHCGYFVIVTSEKMTAREAIDLYKSRDASEKLFIADKTFLGDSCLRVHSEEAATSKIFIAFIALIIRCRMYTNIKDAVKYMDNKPNYMNVVSAIKELEKIEMVRQLDGIYRLDHAVTAKQKTILKAFGIDPGHIRYKAEYISEKLKK